MECVHIRGWKYRILSIDYIEIGGLGVMSVVGSKSWCLWNIVRLHYRKVLESFTSVQYFWKVGSSRNLVCFGMLCMKMEKYLSP